MYYINAPLVEVIVEARWRANEELKADLPSRAHVEVGPDEVRAAEELFVRYAKGLDKLGYRNSERLFPPGSPPIPFQAAMRFRRSAGESPLIQVGASVVTVNGVPPEYTGWSGFRVVVEQALQILIDSRQPADRNFELQLRYLDAFGSEFWVDSSTAIFIRDVLGFSVSLPQSAVARAEPDSATSSNIQLQVPLVGGRKLQLVIGEGQANGQRAALLDSLVVEEDVAPNIGHLMASLDEMHEIQSGMFNEIAIRLGNLLVEGIRA